MNIEELILKKGFTGYLYLFDDETKKRCTLYEIDLLNNTAIFFTIKGIEIYNKLSNEGKEITKFLCNENFVKIFDVAEIEDFTTSLESANQ